MRRDELGDLAAFLAVAQERSFTRAAAKLGTSQSALSHTVRRLEERLRVRLLTRTTRSVATTEAGKRLLDTVGPAVDNIQQQLDNLSEFRDRPSGTIRITTPDHAAQTVLSPVIDNFLHQYPDVQIEIDADTSFTDIVSERIDAGVRLGEQVAKDMIAVRIGPQLRMAVIASPSLFCSAWKAQDAPRTDQPQVHQLADAQLGGFVRVGVREGRPGGECARRRPDYLQRRRADP
jgi:DNA-binding transcriptional LysR family regulator